MTHPQCLSRAVLLASLLMLLPQNAFANESSFPEIAVGLRLSLLFADDRGRDPLFASDATLNPGLAASIQAFEKILGDDHLRVGLEWHSSTEESYLFQRFESTWSEHHALATVDYSYELWGCFAPYLRLGAGVAFYDLDLDADDTTYHADNNWLFSGYGGLGLELFFPWSTELGIRSEFGHTLRMSPELRLGRSGSTPEDETPITVEGSSLGSLPVNGFLWNTEFFVRF